MLETAENRDRSRDSLFLLAEVRLFGSEDRCKARVRNLSAGGMMAEADMNVVLGDRIHVDLRNIGEIDGEVVWKKKGSFGIAFNAPIDPKKARKPVASKDSNNDSSVPRHIRPIHVRRSSLK